MRSNAEFEIDQFKANGKLNSRNIYKILELSTIETYTMAKVELRSVNAAGREIYKGQYNVKCMAEKIFIDMRSYLDPERMDEFKNMQVAIEADNLEIPPRATTGTNLPDGTLKIKVSNAGNKVLSVLSHANNRMVEGNEQIVVPAGSFDCLKISSNLNSKNETLGININFDIKLIEWYARGSGLVRSETYGKSGKLMAYAQLMWIK